MTETEVQEQPLTPRHQSRTWSTAAEAAEAAERPSVRAWRPALGVLDGKAGYVSASGGVDAPGADPGAAGVVLAAVPAHLVGYKNAGSFSSQFKKYMGLLPNDYRLGRIDMHVNPV